MYVDGGFQKLSIDKMLRWTIGDNRTSPYNDPPRRKAGSQRSSLLARYSIVALTKCSIASDLISITINLSGLAMSFTAQFQDPDEVFFVVATLALACGEKRPLTWMSNTCSSNFAVHTIGGTIDGNSSWLSRPLGGLETFCPYFTVGGIQGVHSLTRKHIELDLLFFETPVETSSWK